MRSLPLLLLLSLGLVSCAKKDATPPTGPHATVSMRDGSSYTGRVIATTPAQITLIGDDNQTRVLDTANLKSVEYWDLPTTPAQARAEQLHADHYHPQPSAVTTKTSLVPAGTNISVRTEETIDSRRAIEGQTYPAEVTRDVVDADGAVVIPRGSNAQIVIRSASKGGHFKGRSDLVMDLASVSVSGQQYELRTADIVRTGKQGVGANRRTAKFVGSGAAIGAVIGAIAGGGKGAAIGAASGAGAGATGEIVTKGAAVRVPVETVLTFRLEAPLQVMTAE